MDGLSVVIGPLQKLLDYFQRDRHFSSVKKDEAIRALQSAITETLEYIERSGGEKCFERGTEYGLSAKWNEAAVLIRHISRDLAVRLHDKADYWADQLEWSPEEIQGREIELRAIREELRELIKDS
ncbi:hypothetical protein [Vibrio sp. WXL103]|uniref:hypothetical protein n=1 Tax=Vibrio sp. WXL103 TaxID=3450710 RepID=UPI003EC81D66